MNTDSLNILRNIASQSIMSINQIALLSGASNDDELQSRLKPLLAAKLVEKADSDYIITATGLLWLQNNINTDNICYINQSMNAALSILNYIKNHNIETFAVDEMLHWLDADSPQQSGMNAVMLLGDMGYIMSLGMDRYHVVPQKNLEFVCRGMQEPV